MPTPPRPTPPEPMRSGWVEREPPAKARTPRCEPHRSNDSRNGARPPRPPPAAQSSAPRSRGGSDPPDCRRSRSAAAAAHSADPQPRTEQTPPAPPGAIRAHLGLQIGKAGRIPACCKPECRPKGARQPSLHRTPVLLAAVGLGSRRLGSVWARSTVDGRRWTSRWSSMVGSMVNGLVDGFGWTIDSTGVPWYNWG